MDGIHDMGGMQGWGSVAIDPDEPVFREPWHGRAFAMGAMSMGLSGTNLDAFRHGLERLHPHDLPGRRLLRAQAGVAPRLCWSTAG